MVSQKYEIEAVRNFQGAGGFGARPLQASLLSVILRPMDLTCCHCGKKLQFPDRIGRRDVCPFCGMDLRCCLHCLFYDPAYAGGCKEPQAERVLEKDRSNFCDYFAVRKSSDTGRRREQDKSSKEKLEALFKK